jgi:cation:H+ antiporter
MALTTGTTLTHVLILVLGLGCAAAGGELFVRAAVGLAAWARIPAGIVGATVAAFATSSPELAVGIGSAAAGTPALALGDALGSNVVNLGLVLGTMLLLGGRTRGHGGIRRDTTIGITLPLILALLALDGRLSRIDGGVLVLVFFAWLGLTTAEARRERSATPVVLGERNHRRLVSEGIAGLVFLVGAGRLIVAGAEPIGVDLGLDPFVVGVVIVAVGTSAPELATAIVARLRGHGEIGLGTVLGSNIFNGGLIIGLVAIISPFTVSVSEIDTSLAFGLALVVLVTVVGPARLNRRLGGVLVAGYALSVLTLLATGPAH